MRALVQYANSPQCKPETMEWDGVVGECLERLTELGPAAEQVQIEGLGPGNPRKEPHLVAFMKQQRKEAQEPASQEERERVKAAVAETCLLLLDHGAPVPGSEECANSYLRACVALGLTDVCQALLQRGCVPLPSACKPAWECPLVQAALSGRAHMCQMMVAAGASTEHLQTCLTACIKSLDLAKVQRLVASGVVPAQGLQGAMQVIAQCTATLGGMAAVVQAAGGMQTA